MPRTGIYNPSDLHIDLDNQGSYQPGDSINGLITYTPSLQNAHATLDSLDLKFWARTKTKLIRNNGQHKSIYRGRANLLSQKIPVTEVDNSTARLDQRALNDIANGSRIFRFDAPIPESTDHVSPDRWPAEPFFLSNVGPTASHQLPPEFYYKGTSGWSGTKKEAYVEYVLEVIASLSIPRLNNLPPRLTPRKSTMPVVIRHAGSPTPINEFRLETRPAWIMCKTLQLFPEKQDAGLTFRDRMRTAFKPEKIPSYYCYVTVHYPTVVQIGNPHLPFKISIKPRTETPYTTLPPETFPMVKLTAFSLMLEGLTSIRAKGSLGGTVDTSKTAEYVIYDSNLRVNPDKEIGIEVSPLHQEPFDLGRHMGLVVHRMSAGSTRTVPLPALDAGPDDDTLELLPSYTMTDPATMVPQSGVYLTNTSIYLRPNPEPESQPLSRSPSAISAGTSASSITSSTNHNLEARTTITTTTSSSTPPPPPAYTGPRTTAFHRPLYPNFRTYNIAQTHVLVWKMKLAFVGTDETREVSGRADVRVVGEAASTLAVEEKGFDGRGTKGNHDDMKLFGEAGMGIAQGVLGLFT